MKYSFYCSILICCATILLQGCTNNQKNVQLRAADFIKQRKVLATTLDNYSPQHADNVRMYHTQEDLPKLPYKVIGVATVSKHNLLGIKRQEEVIHKMMKDLAASIGGDALINVSSNDHNVKAHIIAYQRILL